MPVYRMTLKMLAPVHIGSGEGIDPVEYVVTRKQQGEFTDCHLYALDLPALLSRLHGDQRRKFNVAVENNALFYLRKFIAEVADLARDVRWHAACSEAVYEAYCSGLDNDAAQLIINLMARDAATGRPYIPGSSIKGALRTAWVSHKAAAYAGHESLDRIHERDFEPEVLGFRVSTGQRPRAEIRADPFRAVRVSDAPLCENSNSIAEVEIYHPQRGSAGDPGGIRMYYDATFSALDQETITATGHLTIDERLACTSARGARHNWQFEHCVADEIPAEALLRACNEFYQPRLKDELKRFSFADDVRDILLAEADQIADGAALIRLGRFSHIECVTVNRQGGSPSRTGTTRSLFAGELPFGWARISLTSNSSA